MKSITKFLVCATLGLGGLTAQAHAASGDSTVSLGFAHLQLSGLNNFVKDLSLHNLDTFNNFVNENYFNSPENMTMRLSGAMMVKRKVPWE